MNPSFKSQQKNLPDKAADIPNNVDDGKLICGPSYWFQRCCHNFPVMTGHFCRSQKEHKFLKKNIPCNEP